MQDLSNWSDDRLQARLDSLEAMMARESDPKTLKTLTASFNNLLAEQVRRDCAQPAR